MAHDPFDLTRFVEATRHRDVPPPAGPPTPDFDATLDALTALATRPLTREQRSRLAEACVAVWRATTVPRPPGLRAVKSAPIAARTDPTGAP